MKTDDKTNIQIALDKEYEKNALLQKKVAALEGEIEKSKKDQELFNSRIMQLAVKLVNFSIWVRTYRFRFRSKLRKIYDKFTPYKVKMVFNKLYRFIFVKIVEVDNTAFNQKNTPLVSIISPYYNNSKSIGDTLKSVLDQTFKDYEYIIVNDGSSKNESKVLDKFKDDKVRIIHLDENIGKGSPAAARNHGIKQAKGRYIICLDSDDMLEPTYVEKGVITLETRPWISLFSTYTQTFGTTVEQWDYRSYDPRELIHNNMMITATMFRRAAWEQVGGYKEGIGYEDWEFWINLAENGHFGYILPERLFKYRTAEVSRYIEDNKNHKSNILKINSLHPEFMSNVKAHYKKFKKIEFRVNPKTAFINLKDKQQYVSSANNKDSVIIAMSSMTFGGAETLILNFSKQLTDAYDVTFMTGLESDHVWQNRFEKISGKIYHLAENFHTTDIYFEFMSNYISTRNIKILHILHTDFVYDMLPDLKKRHPELRVVLTMFNSRVHHFGRIKDYHQYIELLSADNSPVVGSYIKEIGVKEDDTRVIPNGIDSTNVFNPSLYDKSAARESLGLKQDEIATFFIGRLSEEKNPDVYLQAAKHFDGAIDYKNYKFFIVGDGPMREQVERMSESSKSTYYLGYRSDIAYLLAAADIFVLPSSVEGFPLSILEAMAMNAVCIASRVGAVPDVLGEREGFVVAPGSKTEIVDALTTLYNSREQLSAMQKSSRAKVLELYSGEILGKNYKKLYKDTLNK